MFIQDLAEKKLRDFIFPVGTISNGRFTLQGTAFFIGDKGFAITAAHVVEELDRLGDAVGLFVDASGVWVAIDVINLEKHDYEDVAVIKMQGNNWHSICAISTNKAFSSTEYDLWGYPDHVSNELKMLSTRDEEDVVRPDLIYNRGYVRRLISREMSIGIIRGKSFYEISEVAGECCSGSPLIQRPRNKGPFPVFALYVGESTGDRLFAVGYALRLEAIRGWVPQIIGETLESISASLPN